MITTSLEMLASVSAVPEDVNLAEMVTVLADDATRWHDLMCDAGRAPAIMKMLKETPIRPPWPLLWIDCPLKMKHDKDFARLARLGIEIKSGTREEMNRLFEYRSAYRWRGRKRERQKADINGPNAFIGLMLAVRPDASLWLGDFIVGCDERWRINEEKVDVIMSVDDEPNETIAYLSSWAGLTAHVLALLHVKNAQLVERCIPRQIRRHAKRNNQPVLKTKELVIEPMRKMLRLLEEEIQQNPGQPLPLHLCRGHFKTFTEDRPLLGKFVGTYWWEPHFRGSESIGTIVHEKAKIVIHA